MQTFELTLVTSNRLLLFILTVRSIDVHRIDIIGKICEIVGYNMDYGDTSAEFG